MRDLRWIFRNVFALLFALSQAVTAQPPTASENLFFDTVEVNVVNVEVIVTDKDGVPISGLGPDDFELFEDGEPVKLSNFFAVEGRRAVRSEMGVTPEPDASGGPETQQLNLIVYIDDFNLVPQNRGLIFKNLRKYLTEGFDSRDQVMVVSFNGDVEIIQPFTNDPTLLAAGLDKIEDRMGRAAIFNADRSRILNTIDGSRLPVPNALDPGNFEQAVFQAATLSHEIRNFSLESLQRTRATLRALASFTDSLAGMRGRKAILYISDGLSLRPSDSLVETWLNKFEQWAQEHNQTGLIRDLTGLNTAEFDSAKDFEQLVAHASANRVAFYPLSNAGRALARGSAARSGAGVASFGGRALEVDHLETAGTEASLLTMADGTGGLAFTRSANIGGLLDRMARDFDTFYSLGYTPPTERDASFHEIRVKVRREGATVRHLKGYRQKDPLENLQDLALSAASTGLEDNALGIRLAVDEQTKTKGDRYQVTVMVQIPFEKLMLLPEAEVHTGRVTAYVVVRDLERGGVSTPQRIELPIQIPNDRILEALGQAAAYPLQLDMQEGRKRVSLGVRDNLARVDATVSVEIEVGGQG